jgi:transcriptional regulator with XRE-family HTH domain
MPTKKQRMSEGIRAEIQHATVSRYRIAKETGIEEATLSRFMSRERGLSMEALDALFEFFNLEIAPRRRTRKPDGKTR